MEARLSDSELATSFGIGESDDALAAVTKLYNSINFANISQEEMFKKVDVDGDGVISAKEFADALFNAGVEIDGLEALVRSIDMAAVDSKSADLTNLFSKIEAVGGVSRQMADRALARICAYLNLNRLTAKELFESVDADGSGELDIEELQQALASIGVELSLQNVRNVMTALDFDGGGSLTISEMAAAMDTFMRSRRAFAASVLASTLASLNRKKLSSSCCHWAKSPCRLPCCNSWCLLNSEIRLGWDCSPAAVPELRSGSVRVSVPQNPKSTYQPGCFV